MKRSAGWPWSAITIITGVIALVVLGTIGDGSLWLVLLISSWYSLGRLHQMNAMGIRRIVFGPKTAKEIHE